MRRPARGAAHCTVQPAAHRSTPQHTCAAARLLRSPAMRMRNAHSYSYHSTSARCTEVGVAPVGVLRPSGRAAQVRTEGGE